MSLAAVEARVADAAARTGRDPESVTVVAVSKGRPVAEIARLYEGGHRDFGENRAVELAEKAAVLPADIRWHFVGHLQSNKARLVRPVSCLLHSLDRLSLAKAWLKGAGPPPPCLLEVNVGREPQKSGVDPDDAMGLAGQVSDLGLELLGVMAIIPVVAAPDDARRFFRDLVTMRDEIAARIPSVGRLSMGMSDDFEVAVEEGATVIRVGRAIFEPDHHF
ncbi:MAG: YggS family pyridoxal phosphate-dependent enzyme [Acidimicrobiia bacterium]